MVSVERLSLFLRAAADAAPPPPGAPPPPPPGPPKTLVSQTFGPFYIGILFNYLLWGVQMTQSYYYYKNFRKTDRLWIKASVILLFVTDFVESFCVTQACWVFLVHGWGDLKEVTLFPGELGLGFYATPLTDSFTASIVHFFYAQKIYSLLDAPHNYIWTTLVILLSLTQFTAGLGGFIFVNVIHLTVPDFPRFRTWAIVWLVTAAVTDIVITSLMTLKLSKSRTGFKKTDDIISKLIRMTVETGLATAVWQIIDIIVFLVWPVNSYHLVFAFVAPKLYSNSMLALLNSRKPRSEPTTQTWHSSQERTVEGIQIHTSQTVIGDGYEMEDKLKSKIVSPIPPRPQRGPNDSPQTFYPAMRD